MQIEQLKATQTGRAELGLNIRFVAQSLQFS